MFWIYSSEYIMKLFDTWMYRVSFFYSQVCEAPFFMKHYVAVVFVVRNFILLQKVEKHKDQTKL